MILFRLPFGDIFFEIDENSGSDTVGFTTFDGNETVKFQGEIQIISQEKILENSFFSNEIKRFSPKDFEEINQIEYQQKLEKVIDFIKENQLQKLVISRRKPVVYDTINLSKSFLNLCENYPNAFAYLFYKDGNCWMGAFSELLGRFDKKTGTFETMSLAGTLPINEEWRTKEIDEQKAVTSYIKAILDKFSKSLTHSETYSHPSGNIKHLRTDFQAEISAKNLEELISELHPTPAVCGFPKEFCRNAIKDFEVYDRQLYSGYIRVETEENIQYFVNLRCAQFFQDKAFVYVGGGITSASDCEKEWRETELKSEAIYKNLNFES